MQQTGAEAAIRWRHVSQTYRTRSGEIHAVGDVDIEIAKGSFVALLGPSGCGKSTLLSLTAGLLPVSSGQVETLGRAVTAPVTSVGIVFQRDLLLPWRTALANVLLQAELRGMDRTAATERARSLLRTVGLEGFEDRYPEELSGGMRQRVSIVRALLHDPPLLLMDEPFGALDAMTRDQMNLDILRIWQGTRKTVLFVTHSIEEAVFLADRVLVMNSRPGHIALDLAVDLPRPRRLAVRDTSDFRTLCTTIRRLFESMGLLREGAA